MCVDADVKNKGRLGQQPPPQGMKETAIYPALSPDREKGEREVAHGEEKRTRKVESR